MTNIHHHLAVRAQHAHHLITLSRNLKLRPSHDGPDVCEWTLDQNIHWPQCPALRLRTPQADSPLNLKCSTRKEN